ncbi:ABC transporter permease [Otoolea muris]|uniref:ABC transporter permease n=1 Tax=Otoolea muris TaxID=2941515 RepID=UPI00203EF05D|nr:ABC transporter permease [Otoolea muris]
MWKDYSAGYIKNNRSSSQSVMIAAFISALLLSLLCGLFYNAWKYEVERIEQEEGGWHSRISGEFTEKDMETVKNFAHVKDAVVNEKESDSAETVLDIYFGDMGSVFSDTPHIAQQIGAAPEKIVYHYELLAMYLIRDSSDTAPRLLFPIFILITLAASFSLIVIIHNSFAVSMNARIHQFGIFSSIGATPKQIRTCLLQEAAALSAIPLILGNLSGIAGSMGLLQMVNVLLGSDIPGRHKSVFGYHPLVLVLTLIVSALTIWISAWLPARKLSKLTPLQAIRNTGELQLKRRKNSHFLSLLFGVEGELAGNALKAQRKALRTSSLSFISAFMAFTVMQCFFALSGISTRETYFERYQGVWDVMVTVKDTDADAFEETERIQGIDGLESAVIYQKAMAKRVITEEEMGEEMKSFGGFSNAPSNYATQVDGGWLVDAPVIILDDNSFLAYCEQIEITPQLHGAVILNQIRDVTNPDFRHPDFMPYIKEPGAGEDAASILRQSGNEQVTAEIPVLAYTEKVPVLREEYATLNYYELVHFIPVSLWMEIGGQIGGAEEDSYIRIQGKENASLEELNMLQDELGQILSGKYTIESENRIQEYETNNKQIQGMMAIFGGFCILLAIIGIGNVFSNTLGFVRQRKREFARYMSVGMTPKELRKMFCTEALVIAGRPVLISLPLVMIAVAYMLKASYLEVEVFMAEAPWLPISLFMLAILGCVALAYYLAWRNVRKISLAEVLRDDTMM